MTVKEKRCTKCGEVKPVDEFYLQSNNYYLSYCKKCDRERKRMRYQKVEKIFNAPNKYSSDEQRNDTFKIMTILGWQYNSTNGVWYKEGIKDMNGNWIFEKHAK